MLHHFSQLLLSHRCSHLHVHLFSSSSDGNQPLHPAWGLDGCRGSGSIPKVILLKGLWLQKSEMSVVKYVPWLLTRQLACLVVWFFHFPYYGWQGSHHRFFKQVCLIVIIERSSSGLKPWMMMRPDVLMRMMKS